MGFAPPERIVVAADRRVRKRADYVLYWMIAARRPSVNFALDHALAHARALQLPLLVFEPLRAGYRWASDRMHRFVLDGMAANAAAFAAAGVTYFPYVEPSPGAGRGLLAALAERAAVVVTDQQPGFFQPRMVAAAALRIDARLEVIDSVGLLPLAMHGRAFPTAASFRWHWQKIIAPHLAVGPDARPLSRLPRALLGAELPAAILTRWPAATAPLLAGVGLDQLPIDHAVRPVDYRGGHVVGAKVVSRFIAARLASYHEARNQPELEVASGLSPYLHFGHVGVHAVAHAV